MRGFQNTGRISKHKCGFDVYTRTDRKKDYYAHCKTLIQALMIRDYGLANDWKPFPKIHTSKTHEPYIHKNGKKYCIIKQVQGKLIYFGIYDKLDDAIAERDLLIKHNWDYDVICEGIDERNDNKTIFLGCECHV